MFYFGTQRPGRYDIWTSRRTLHIHCGIIVFEFSLPLNGPAKADTNQRRYGKAATRYRAPTGC
jgi:hypothetical protein